MKLTNKTFPFYLLASSSTIGVDVLGSSIFVAIRRPEMSTYWNSESEEVCSDELKLSVEGKLASETESESLF